MRKFPLLFPKLQGQVIKIPNNYAIIFHNLPAVICHSVIHMTIPEIIIAYISSLIIFIFHMIFGGINYEKSKE